MTANRNPSPEVPETEGQTAREPGRPSAQPRDAAGRFLPTHGAYRLERAWQRGKLPRVARRLVNHLRFDYSISLGFASWTSTAAPARAAIDNAIRQQLLAERLFRGFWAGEEPPKRFDTVSENLRRALADLGIEPKGSGRSLAEYVAQRYGGHGAGA